MATQKDGQRLTIFGLTWREHHTLRMEQVLREYNCLPTSRDRGSLFAALFTLGSGMSVEESRPLEVWLRQGGTFPRRTIAMGDVPQGGAMEAVGQAQEVDGDITMLDDGGEHNAAAVRNNRFIDSIGHIDEDLVQHSASNGLHPRMPGHYHYNVPEAAQKDIPERQTLEPSAFRAAVQRRIEAARQSTNLRKQAPRRLNRGRGLGAAPDMTFRGTGHRLGEESEATMPLDFNLPENVGPPEEDNLARPTSTDHPSRTVLGDDTSVFNRNAIRARRNAINDRRHYDPRHRHFGLAPPPPQVDMTFAARGHRLGEESDVLSYAPIPPGVEMNLGPNLSALPATGMRNVTRNRTDFGPYSSRIPFSGAPPDEYEHEYGDDGEEDWIGDALLPGNFGPGQRLGDEVTAPNIPTSSTSANLGLLTQRQQNIQPDFIPPGPDRHSGLGPALTQHWIGPRGPLLDGPPAQSSYSPTPHPGQPHTFSPYPQSALDRLSNEHNQEIHRRPVAESGMFFDHPPAGTNVGTGMHGFDLVSGRTGAQAPDRPSPGPELEECILCGNDAPQSDMAPSQIAADCRHGVVGSNQYNPRICQLCLQRHIQMIIGSGSLKRLICPLCPAAFTRDHIKEYATEEVFARYEYLLLMANPDIVMCLAPTCKSGQLHTSSLGPKVVCNTCSFATCAHHKYPWHEGLTCAEFDVSDVMIERLEEAELTAKLLAKDKSQVCTNCQHGVTRIDGCDHMTCACGKEWCYQCGADYEITKRLGGRGHLNTCMYHPNRVRATKDHETAKQNTMLGALHGGASEGLERARGARNVRVREEMRPKLAEAAEKRIASMESNKVEEAPAKKKKYNMHVPWEEK